MLRKLAAALVIASAALALWHFSSSRQQVSVSYQNVDGTYSDPVSVLSKSVRQGKKVTIRTPSSKLYASKTVTYRAGGRKNIVIRVPRRKVSMNVSGKHLHWKLLVNGEESDGHNILIGSRYSVDDITPDSGYVYSGIRGGSSAGTADRNMNLVLESVKKHYRTVMSYSNGEAILLSLRKGDRISLSDKITVPADCTLASIKCGDKSYELGDVFVQPDHNAQIDVVFKEIWYTVTYHDAYDNPNPTKYRRSLTLASPKRDGYEFIGWQMDGSFVKSINHQNAELTAIWKKTATVSFDANGGDGTMTPHAGTQITVPECTFVNGGYSFDGWNTKKDGSGTMYKPGDKISSDTVLYAQWKANTSDDVTDASTKTDTEEESPESTSENQDDTAENQNDTAESDASSTGKGDTAQSAENSVDMESSQAKQREK